MKTLNSTNEFTVGKHGIGWLDSDFKTRLGDINFEPRTLGTFQKLPRYMSDTEIMAELKPGECELGDVLALLENPPEGTKDGYSNIFYIKDTTFVVRVYWDSYASYWYVYAWQRVERVWSSVERVFSPATPSVSDSLTPKPSMSSTLKSSPKFLYSFDGHTEYIELKKGEMCETLEIRKGLNLDLNNKGEIVGIEIVE